jgi:hypothetical protein
MPSTKVKQKCVDCGIIFERSKFNPYLDRCEKHRTKKVDKKAPKSKKKEKEGETPLIVLPTPQTVQFKKPVLVIEKEKIFAHLLSRGWKLSTNNKLHKKTDKVHIIATLGSDGSPSAKFSVSFWEGKSFMGFDGSMVVVDKAQLKKLPIDITDDLEGIINFIWPEEDGDAKAND